MSGEPTNFAHVQILSQSAIIRQLPIKPVQKIGNQTLKANNPKCQTRTSPSPKTKRNEMEILTVEIDQIVLKPFRYELIRLVPQTRVPMDCPCIYHDSCFCWNIIASYLDT
ncbi:hypothetical protein TorRG33x02_284610 [Trema orientale]|uniref:Uncharacterized protein n=1 Tax=Trema orientale TaxID=63057 RepID=A0A2P5CHH3_TREOI|nr:hypothetical protein TorRG33x02_284610 [Trema orientale]